MQIKEIQQTPNPQAIIVQMRESLTSTFQSEEFFEDSPSPPDFVESLFDCSNQLDSVMIQGNQITLRLKESSWEDEKDLLKDLAPYIREADPLGEGSIDRESSEDIDPKMELIQEVLEQEILPYLKSHGGDINIIELRDNDELIIEYKGACGGCPAAFTGTLKGIQSLLQKEVDPNIDVKLQELPF